MDPSEAIAVAEELERRDLALAGELEAIEMLVRQTAALRARALDLDAALSALPTEQEVANGAIRSSEDERRGAAAALTDAEARAAGLGRLSSQDDRDQAERELRRAREELHDADVRHARAVARLDELGARARSLESEVAHVLSEAAATAGSIRDSVRVPDAGKGDPGATLASVEEWGARARAALFVAHGTLQTERERVVVEANTLGAAVLGEPLGGSSATLVRRRLEAAVAAGA